MTAPSAPHPRVHWQRLVIVADDLTGAAEAAGALSHVAPAGVVLGELPRRAGVGVVSLDTDSRSVAPRLAAERVGRAVRNTFAPDTCYMKKIDSLLRGNVAVEIAAALEQIRSHTGAGVALVSAANPLIGRTVRGGRLHVPENVRAEVERGDIVALLQEAGMRTCVVAAPRPDQEPSFIGRVEQAESQGHDAVVLDAETQEDLLHTAALLDPCRVDRLLVGTGGLARAIAASTGAAECPRRSTAVSPGPILVVIGSHSLAAQAQREHLLTNKVRSVAVPTDPTAHDLAVAGRQLRTAVLQEKAAVLHLTADRLPSQMATRLIQAVAELVVEVVDHLGVLALTGGETARAVLTRCGVNDLQIVNELQPGVVALRSAAVAPLLVTKPGSYGAPDLFSKLVQSQVDGELI